MELQLLQVGVVVLVAAYTLTGAAVFLHLEQDSLMDLAYQAFLLLP